MKNYFKKSIFLMGMACSLGTISAQSLLPRLQLDFNRGVVEKPLGFKTDGMPNKLCELDSQVFDWYPLASYQTDTTHLGYIAVGEMLPDEILDLPLVVAHAHRGKDTVSLREYSNSEYIVLNFWNKNNESGMSTMIQWEELFHKVFKQMTVLGAYLGYDHEALDEMKERKWHHPQVVTAGARILNRYFCRQPGTSGLSAWIYQGRFMGFVKGGRMPDHFVQQVMKGGFDELPSDMVATIPHQGASKRSLLHISKAVTGIPEKAATARLRASRCETIQHRYRDFPRVKREIDTNYLGYILPGEQIPDEILDLPLLAVNRLIGRDTITLREYSKTRFLIMDFWARWCSPCLASMQKWEDLREEIEPYITVLGVHMDADVKAVEEIHLRKWNNPQIIGNTAYILNRYFAKIPYLVGPSAWIHDGRFIGLTESTALSRELLDEMISTGATSLPESASRMQY